LKVALTGATGFLGREIVNRFQEKHDLRCWTRKPNQSEPDESEPDESGTNDVAWVPGELGDIAAARELVHGCDVLIHSAHFKPGDRFQGQEGDIVEYVQRNVVGSLMLIRAAVDARLKKIVLVSSGAVHEQILDDRLLDEAHPLWPKSHYGAHKAALEAFASSYGRGHGVPVCVLRPTAIYGVDEPIEKSLWYQGVADVVAGKDVVAKKARKVVHVADVAKATEILMETRGNEGEVYSCCDRSVSDFEVLSMAKEISNSVSNVGGEDKKALHRIDTGKLHTAGMEFGGNSLLRESIGQLVGGICG